ncbi:MAG: DoxX family protein [Candidatus Nitrotoga sp.]
MLIRNTLNRFGPLAGRVLIALIFVMAGFSKIDGFDGTVGYIESKGLPMPQVLAIGAILVELGGGILLIVGRNARLAAAALFVFTAMTAIFFHNFWSVPPDEAQNQMIVFMKNVSMMGGLLYVVVHGSGPYSLSSGNDTKF